MLNESIVDEIIEAFKNYPELITDNKFKGSKDCITGKSIRCGTRIVTTTYNTKKKYGIEKYNVTMTIDTYKSLNTGHNSTRNGQIIWDKDPRNKHNVVNRLFVPHKKVYTNVDYTDVDYILNNINDI